MQVWEILRSTLSLRLYPRKLSGRIDYSHIGPGSIYWKWRFEIDRPWNDFGNFDDTRRVSHFFTCERRSSSDTFSFGWIEGRCEIFIQPEDLSFVKSVSSFFISRIWKRHVFSFRRNELSFCICRQTSRRFICKYELRNLWKVLMLARFS